MPTAKTSRPATAGSQHPIDLSTRVLDSGVVDGPVNRVSHELSELADGVAMVESFSHVVLVRTDDGLVVFDTSTAHNSVAVVESLRRWTDEPVRAIVYTHGHIDHVGGSRTFAADAQSSQRPVPDVIGQANVLARMNRYALTSGYNQVINRRQFGGAALGQTEVEGKEFLPQGTLRPNVTYEESLVKDIGGVTFEFNHCLGETDDHTWTWLPQHKMIAAGDQFIWNFPNCGNPQKVQRYPLEWAGSLREMARCEPELFVPAHGLPIAGVARIARCLTMVADTLETLVSEVIAAMNTGATLDQIVHGVSVPAESLELPYLRPLYDEPEFVIRNIWRLYGGWWDGNPARLKPASDRAVGVEVVALAGGVESVVARALELSAQHEHRLACHLIELAAHCVAPDSVEASSGVAGAELGMVHEARASIYAARRRSEASLMARGIYRSAENESHLVATGEAPAVEMMVSLGE